MDILERFRRRVPRWEDPDPMTRAEGVREDVRVEERDLLEKIASSDPDPRVRRAAVRKLSRAQALLLASSDPHEDVREVASEALVELAKGRDQASAEVALQGLKETRHLTAVAREGSLPSLRLAAAERVSEGRPLALLARSAEDAAVRARALERLEEPSLLVEVALKGEHKTTMLAAVERLNDVEALKVVAGKAALKAAARRAQAKLQALVPHEEPPSEEPEPQEGAPAEAREAPEEEPVGGQEEVHEPRGLETLLESLVEEPEASPQAETAPADEVKEAPAPSEEHQDPVVPPQAEARPPEPSTPGITADEKGGEDAERERRERAQAAERLGGRLEDLAKAETLTLPSAEGALREARALLATALPGRTEHRLRTARAALFARAQELREADEWTRWSNAAVQEELAQRLEGLAAREDLEAVAKELRDADSRWAAARLAPRDQAEALRQRYQAARAPLKAKLDVYFAQKAAEQAENLKKKLALCERAESWSESKEWLKVARELKGLQAEWKTIGGAMPREERAAWKRFHAACDRFFTRRQEDLKHQKEAWSENLGKKEELCAKAEALAASTEWEKAAAEVRRLQVEWKDVGAVRRRHSEAVWLRFRKACDAFFERYKRRGELDALEKRGEREGLCRELEEIVPAGGVPPEDLAARVLALMTRARQQPPLPMADEEALTRRLVVARNHLVEAHPESFKGTELDPVANKARREKLCARVEALAAQLLEAAPPAELTGDALARRLKEALATNTMGGRAESEARRRAEKAEVESARAAWKRLGPVPGAQGEALEARFKEACSRFLEATKGASATALSAR